MYTFFCIYENYYSKFMLIHILQNWRSGLVIYIYIALGKGTNFSQNLDVPCFDAAQVAWWLGCMVAACKRASLRYRHAFVAQDSPQ